MRAVQAADRSGGWDYSGGFRRRANRSLALARNSHARYIPVRDAFFAASSHTHPDQDALFAGYDEARIHADGTVLFAALAVESALNLYGVVRLSERFYQAHYERLGLVAKVSAVLATCLGKLVEKSDPIVVSAAAISTLRNGLAHPKAKEIESFNDLADRNGYLQEAEAAVVEMEKFFVQFVALDSDAEWIAGTA